jgi:maltose O-acetyltransferase
MFRWLAHFVSRFRERRARAYLQRLISRGMTLGRNVSFQDGVFLDPDHCFLITIGDDCVFAPNVRVIAHDASTKFVVGHTRLGRVTIGKRCFIGDSTIILPNVTIGDDCVIGAGSVVHKDIASGSIAAGNPARVLGTIADYRARHERAMNEGRSFDVTYHIDSISQTGKQEILNALDRGPAYIQ